MSTDRPLTGGGFCGFCGKGIGEGWSPAMTCTCECANCEALRRELADVTRRLQEAEAALSRADRIIADEGIET